MSDHGSLNPRGLRMILAALVVASAGLLGYTRGGGDSRESSWNTSADARVGSAERHLRTRRAALPVPPVVGPPGLALRDGIPRGVEPLEIFRAETRDEVWAGQVEATFQAEYAKYTSVLVPYGKELTFTCRKQSCEMTIEVPLDKLVEAQSLVQGFALSGTVQPSVAEDEPGTLVLSVVSFFDKDARDPLQIQRAFSAEMVRRFPGGYEATRKWLDEHGMGDDPR